MSAEQLMFKRYQEILANSARLLEERLARLAREREKLTKLYESGLTFRYNSLDEFLYEWCTYSRTIDIDPDDLVKLRELHMVPDENGKIEGLSLVTVNLVD